jgi:hypothetical protein
LPETVQGTHPLEEALDFVAEGDGARTVFKGADVVGDFFLDLGEEGADDGWVQGLMRGTEDC